MMMMTMKKRPIRKSSQTSIGAAFIDWCFKSGNGSLGVVQYHRALGALIGYLGTVRYIQFCHTRLVDSTPLRYSRNFGGETVHSYYSECT